MRLRTGSQVPETATRSRGDLRPRVRLRPIALALLLLAAGSVDAVEGLPLSEALELLRAEGVPTLYTSGLVTDDLKVEDLPPPGPPRRRLAVLLAPHGLTAKAGPDGHWVVVRAREGTLEGAIVADPGGQPVDGATIHVLGPMLEARSDPTGRFRILRAPAGDDTLRISRPGFVDLEVPVEIPPGGLATVEIEMTIDADLHEEVFVSTTLEQPALGTWQAPSERHRSAVRLDQDLFEAAAEAPGSEGGLGNAFGVRGSDADRLTVVLDGVEVIEPFHLRTLGSPAGVVTPGAVAEISLHRGSPPLIYGDRAGGVLELTTRPPEGRFDGRLGLGDEAAHGSARGVLAAGRLRWSAAARHGRPDLPNRVSALEERPFFSDAVASISAVLGERHDLRLKCLWVEDEYHYDRVHPGFNTVRAIVGQRSDHVAARYLGTLGRHVLDVTTSHSTVDRKRFLGEDAGRILTFPSWQSGFAYYRIDDPRHTRRRALRLVSTSTVHDRLDLTLGAEVAEETTHYRYTAITGFRTPTIPVPDPGFDAGGQKTIVELVRQDEQAAFGRASLRLRADLSVELGLRWDRDELADGGQLAPRVAVTARRGSGVWRAQWARVRTGAATHELRLPDGLETLPEVEDTTHASLGFSRQRARTDLSIELYRQRVDDPRTRFLNLYEAVSRFPEIEVDRIRLTPERGRSEGLELQLRFRGRHWEGRTSYELSRSEDLLDGRWTPRRDDRRHRLRLALSAELPGSVRAELRWRGASGRPTTSIDPALALADFDAALGEVHAERLPGVHELDVRLSRVWSWRGWDLGVEGGIDNLTDRQNIVGYDLYSLSDPQTPSLTAELAPGRRLRWGLELSW